MIKIDTEKNMLVFGGALDELITEMANIIYSILSGAANHDNQEDLKRAMRLAYKVAEEQISKEAEDTDKESES